MTTHRWLELDDDGNILLVIDRGDGFDLITAVVRDDYELRPHLQARWHELDAQRREARAFGAACAAEVVGEWERTRGHL
jgi:hypothetical protein